MNYSIRTKSGTRQIWDERGQSIVSIAKTKEGERLYGCMITGMLSAGCTLFDSDKGEYIIGDLGQLS